MLKAKYYALCIMYCALFFCLQFATAQNLPALKNKAEAVQDYVGLLSESDRTALNEKLRSYTDSTSTGIVIAIVGTVDDDINYEAAQLLTKWGVGQKGKDNGALILMAAESRRVAISTGYGVESILTDALCKQIIEQDMIPAFKRGDYYAGFDAATTSIMQVLQGTFKPSATDKYVKYVDNSQNYIIGGDSASSSFWNELLEVFERFSTFFILFLFFSLLSLSLRLLEAWRYQREKNKEIKAKGKRGHITFLEAFTIINAQHYSTDEDSTTYSRSGSSSSRSSSSSSSSSFGGGRSGGGGASGSW